MFNIFRYALYNDSDLSASSGEDFAFADNVVQAALSSGQDTKLAAEAAVIMNIWMFIAHRLYEAVRVCRDKKDPVPFIDSAVALWIGKEQKEGKFGQGWMLYSVAQSAAQFFGLQEGEALVNTELMQLFNDAQNIGRNCSQSGDAPDKLYFQVQDLIRALSKPLISNLLFHLVSNSKNMLQLYAVSVVPQAFACNEDVGAALESALFKNFSNSSLTNDLLDQLAAFLQCQRIVSNDLTHSTNAPTELRNLLSSLDDKLGLSINNRVAPSVLVGYDSTTDVSEISRLDMDVLEIKIMMRTDAYQVAQDIYKLGHNVEGGFGFSTGPRLSLQSIALAHNNRTSEVSSELLSQYYGTPFVANGIIEIAMDRTGNFTTASRDQLSVIVTRTLQTMVMLDAVFDRMSEARRLCFLATNATNATTNLVQKSQAHWDQAVALFSGSIEGRLFDGQEAGFFMYALGNEVCSYFGTCKASGESHVDQSIVIQFAAGRDAITNGNCDSVERIQESKLKPLLLTALIQGTISFAAAAQSDPDIAAAAYILAKAVVPFVDQANATSSATIESSLGDFAAIEASHPIGSIVEAFAYALQGMGIDCKSVGVLGTGSGNFSTCIGNDVPGGNETGGSVPHQVSVSKTPTDLGNGLYVTNTYVQDRANIARDIVDIQSALGSNSYSMAKLIYEDGKNSAVYSTNGKFERLRSLESFSTEDTKKMVDEPLFNIFMYALQDQKGTFMSRDVRLYADSIVMDTFDNISAQTEALPVEAMLVLNLWMEIAHVLYTALEACKNKTIAVKDGIHSMDIAVAYWIGDGQVTGSGNNGHLLYALAVKMGEQFTMDEGGQSRTNTNILKLFKEAKVQISIPGACAGKPKPYLQLSRTLNEIISLMAVPLIQGLIHNLRSNDRSRVKLYAHAVVPLAAACSPGAFNYLKEKLLGMTYNVVEIENIISSIRSIYPCLGLSCSDIGVHKTESNGTAAACKDPGPMGYLAGYKPKYNVGEFARLDFDMREMDILLEMGAHAAAENIYTYGKHVQSTANGSLSLFDLATTNDRPIVPTFDTFLRYYGHTYNDPRMYADIIIRSAFNNSGVVQWTDPQRKIIAMKSAQVLVMYFAALQPLYEAVSSCGSTNRRRLGSNSSFGDKWDQGAAMLIGSLAGNMTNGTQQGYMFYDLAQENCHEFATCRAGRSSAVNERLVSLLYAGRGALISDSCASARHTADKISSLLLIPIIQGTLSSAIHLSTAKGAEAELYRAEGYVYSRALLPFVATADRGAAQTLDSYLGFPAPVSTRNTIRTVFSSLAMAYPQMNVDCELIGKIEGHDPCNGAQNERNLGNWIWILLASILGVCCLCQCAFLVRKRKRSRRRLPDNNPRFIAPETGELIVNHSMDLLEKAFSRTSARALNIESQETVGLTEDMYTDTSSGGHDDDVESASDDSSSSSGSTLEEVI